MDLNSVSQNELENLPHIGSVLAATHHRRRTVSVHAGRGPSSGDWSVVGQPIETVGNGRTSAIQPLGRERNAIRKIEACHHTHKLTIMIMCREHTFNINLANIRL